MTTETSNFTPPSELAKIVDGEVVIRVSMAAMVNGFKLHDHFFNAKDNGYPMIVTDETALMKSFVDRLNEESETGETIITRAFDKAIENVFESGDDGIEEDPNPPSRQEDACLNCGASECGGRCAGDDMMGG